MYQFVFRNKWVALAFVILILVGVRVLIGPEGGDGAISHPKTELIAQREQTHQQMDKLNAAQSKQADIPPPPDAAEKDYADDSDLIDDTKGYDPSPEVEEPADPSPDQDGGYQAGYGD